MADLFSSVKMAELPPVLERAAGLSPVILLFVGMCLPIFPFDVWISFGFCFGQCLKYLY